MVEETATNNLKKWWKITNKKKNSSRLDFTEYPQWFKIGNPILSDTNKRLDSLCSDTADTSFILQKK